MGYPRYQRARAHKFASRTAGDIVVAQSANMASLDTALDLTLEGQIGDVLEFTPNFRANNTASDAYFDAATIVSAAAVNYFSGLGIAGVGVGGWFTPASVYSSIGGSFWYTVVAGDISSGLVTVRLVGRAASASAKTVNAGSSTQWPLRVQLRNLGPVDPN